MVQESLLVPAVETGLRDWQQVTGALLLCVQAETCVVVQPGPPRGDESAHPSIIPMQVLKALLSEHAATSMHEIPTECTLHHAFTMQQPLLCSVGR